MGHITADAITDTLGATAIEAHLLALQERERELPADADPSDRASLHLEIGRALVELGRGAEAWELSRPAFDVFAAAEDWENAAAVCDLLFRSDQPGSLSALGQGIWLAVTYPIDPTLAVGLLQHVVDDTPDDADGAAVAATTAVYVADRRAEGKERERVMFFANQMLGTVARRHGGVESQEAFERWFKRLELDNPNLFLPRLRNVVDVLVQDDWWIDREALQSKLPVN